MEHADRLWVRGGFRKARPRALGPRKHGMAASLRPDFLERDLPPLGVRTAPKVFIRDPGLLHALLNLPTKQDIEGHPKLGASWEGFIIDQLVQELGVNPEETYHWQTYQSAELDLLVVRGGLRLGFEFKRTVAPTLTIDALGDA